MVLFARLPPKIEWGKLRATVQDGTGLSGWPAGAYAILAWLRR